MCNFYALLENPEIGCIYQGVGVPFIGLPCADIDQRVFFLEINQQEKITFIGIGGGGIMLAHGNPVNLRRIAFGADLESAEINGYVFLIIKHLFLAGDVLFFVS
jgi:hypothetical protein